MDLMNLQFRGINVLLLLLLLTPDHGLAQTLRQYRSKNGIRLQGGSGSKGRLEVSSRNAWFADGDGTAAWSPVCASDDFTDELAETMCQMLAYSYGRRFYGPSITYRKNETGALYVGNIACTPNIASPPPPPGRRPPPLMSSNSPPPPASPEPVASPPPSSPPPATPPPASPEPASPAPSSNPTPIPGYGPAPGGQLDTTPAAARHHRRHRQHRRQLLRDDSSSSSSLLAAAASGVILSQQQEVEEGVTRQQQQQRQQRHSSRARSLYSPVRGTINTPRSSPFSCSIKPGGCDVKGPFVGIECSHTPMVEAPPPPPAPPAPPAAPPAVSAFIRMYGPALSPDSIVSGDVEPNLADDMLGSFYGRLDLQVDLNGSRVWAPLCTSADSDPYSWYYLAYVACGQLYDWPKPYDGGIGFVQSQVSDRSFRLPEGPFAPGDFDPSAYSAYVTVTGSSGTWGDRALQELTLEVSSTPCASGEMLAVACLPFGERRRS